MDIRNATSNDIPQLLELNLAFNGEEVDATAETMHRHLCENAAEMVLVAEEEGRLIGFLCARVDRSICYAGPSAEITELYVQPQGRRRGAATMLLQEAERKLAALGVHELRLLTGRENAPAQGVYLRNGFLVEDEVVFHKDIGAGGQHVR